MIVAAIESLTERLEEIKALFPKHWEELALNKDKVPLDPQYDVYLSRDAAGQVMFCCVRKDGQIIGYFVGFVTPGLHYRTCLTLQMDIFFIDPAYRDGTSTAPVKLFRAVEKEAKRRGVQRWVVGSKVAHDASRLFEFLGFEKIETIYSKWIGE